MSVMTKATMVLRAGVVAVALLIAGAYNPAKAQLILEMSALTCKNIIEVPPERQILIAAWMSGYFNAERNMPTVEFGRFETNKNRVMKYCQGHRNVNLMRAIRTVAF
jgi:acid stress chaperone HdeB